MSGFESNACDLGGWLAGLAYVNPGIGTLILQMILAGVVGASLWLKRSGSWLNSLFSKKKPGG